MAFCVSVPPRQNAAKLAFEGEPFYRQQFSQTVAAHFECVPAECQRGRHELPVRERVAFHHCRNHGRRERQPNTPSASQMLNAQRPMQSIAYLSNQFPDPLEAYVGEEISELRQRGQNVISCSTLRPSSRCSRESAPEFVSAKSGTTLYVFPLRAKHAFGATLLVLSSFARIADLVW